MRNTGVDQQGGGQSVFFALNISYKEHFPLRYVSRRRSQVLHMGKTLSHKRQDEESGADAYCWAGVPEAAGAVQDPTQEGECPGHWVHPLT